MADGKVIFEYVGDTSGVDKANSEAEGKIKSGTGKFAGLAKGAALAIGGAAVAAGGAALKFGVDFEQSMANASTLFGSVNVNMDALNKKTLALSNSSGVAADEIGNALYQALSSGIPATEDMADMMLFLESSTKLAKTGQADLESVVDVTTTVLNGYNMSVEETDRVHRMLQNTQDLGKTTVNELAASLANVVPVAAAMNVGFDQVSASLSVMTAAGIPTAEATTQLKGLFAELGKSGTKGAEALAAAAQGTKFAGMSFQEMMASGADLNTVVDMLGGYAKKSGLSMLDMFGSIEAGNAALSVGGENSKAFGDALKGMNSDVDSVGAAYDKITGTSGASFEKLMNQLKNAAIELFIQLGPLLTEALPVLTDLFTQLMPPIMELVKGLLPPLMDLFNLLMDPLMELINLVLPVVIDLWNQLVPPLMQLISALLPPLLEILDAILEPLMDLITDLLPPLVDLFLIVADVIKMLTPVIKELASYISGILSAAFKSVGQHVKNLVGIFRGIIDYIKNVFTGNWKGAWQNVQDIFSNIIGALSTIFKFPINLVIGGINGFIAGINKIKLPNWEILGGWAGKSFNIPQIPRLKVGLDYVPSDYFPAYLDEGEAVLTKKQANLYRAFGGVEGMLSYGFKMAAGAEAQTIIVQPNSLYLDGREIAKSTNTHNYNDIQVRRLR